MIDARLLADSSVCPACGERLLEQGNRCPSCGVDLRGELASRIWQVSQQASGLLVERARLIAQLRAQADESTSTMDNPVAADLQRPPRSTPASAGLIHPAGPAAGGAREAGPIPVRNVLLGLGVLLLAVAAVIFVVVAWRGLGTGGRAAILAVATMTAGLSAHAATRRGLTATGEALAALTVALLILDGYGVRAAGLAVAHDVSPSTYWALVLALITGIAGLTAWLSRQATPRLATPRLAALVLGQLPVPLLAVEAGSAVAWALFVTAQALVLALVDVPLARQAEQHGNDVGARLICALGALLAWLIAVTVAGAEAFANQDEPSAGEVLLLLALALTAAAAAWAQRTRIAVAQLLAGASAAAFLSTGWAAILSTGAVSESWEPAAAAALSLAGVVALLLIAVPWRPGPAVAIGVAGLMPLSSSADTFEVALLGPFGWWTQPWSIPLSSDARAVVAPTEQWLDGNPYVLAVAVIAIAAVLLGRAIGFASIGLAAGAALSGAVAAILPLAVNAPYAAAVGYQLALGTAGAIAGAYLSRRTWVGFAVSAGGAAVLALAVSWSVAAEPMSPVAFGVAAVAFGVAWVVAPEQSRLWYAALSTAAIAAEAYAIARSSGLAVDGSGFAVCLVASVLAVAAGRLLTGRSRVAVEATASGALAVGLIAAGNDPGWLAHSLAVCGVAAAVVALLPDRRRVAWLSGALLTLSSWVRLGIADVSAVEAYTVPPALALIGVGLWRRRQDPAAGSWRTLGPGLALALLPSLLATLGDPGVARPLILGLAALGVTLYGARSHLQAPLVIGGATLAVDAVAQIAPYAAALPRWVGIGAAGLLLLGLGTTYERRMRDLRSLANRLAQLH